MLQTWIFVGQGASDFPLGVVEVENITLTYRGYLSDGNHVLVNREIFRTVQTEKMASDGLLTTAGSIGVIIANQIPWEIIFTVKKYELISKKLKSKINQCNLSCWVIKFDCVIIN